MKYAAYLTDGRFVGLTTWATYQRVRDVKRDQRITVVEVDGPDVDIETKEGFDRVKNFLIRRTEKQS